VADQHPQRERNNHEKTDFSGVLHWLVICGVQNARSFYGCDRCRVRRGQACESCNRSRRHYPLAGMGQERKRQGNILFQQGNIPHHFRTSRESYNDNRAFRTKCGIADNALIKPRRRRGAVRREHEAASAAMKG